jgi:hypothetical protein
VTITRRIRAATALAMCATATVAGLLVATPAQAQSAAPIVPAAGNTAVSMHAADSGKMADVAAPRCDFIISRGTAIQMCNLGTYLDGGRPYRWPVTHLDASVFSNRVWFHQNEDGSGWSKCYSGGSIENIPVAFQDPGNILLSANTAPCP